MMFKEVIKHNNSNMSKCSVNNNKKQLWQLNNLKSEEVKMMMIQMMIKKFQEHIIPPNMPTYKSHKMSKIYSNISRDTSLKR